MENVKVFERDILFLKKTLRTLFICALILFWSFIGCIYVFNRHVIYYVISGVLLIYLISYYIHDLKTDLQKEVTVGSDFVTVVSRKLFGGIDVKSLPIKSVKGIKSQRIYKDGIFKEMRYFLSYIENRDGEETEQTLMLKGFSDRKIAEIADCVAKVTGKNVWKDLKASQNISDSEKRFILLSNEEFDFASKSTKTLTPNIAACVIALVLTLFFTVNTLTKSEEIMITGFGECLFAFTLLVVLTWSLYKKLRSIKIKPSYTRDFVIYDDSFLIGGEGYKFTDIRKVYMTKPYVEEYDPESFFAYIEISTDYATRKYALDISPDAYRPNSKYPDDNPDFLRKFKGYPKFNETDLKAFYVSVHQTCEDFNIPCFDLEPKF